eukprot:TRINITY_DN5855_c0_g1_i3.p1 TRINITY_DN5855_c0_g1~~TRINITY_DN5855_c0_g1_i3.p1  ORF type:complete len:222 (+),score=16.98 TRINITY_DN5855_c0_g1_i3:52-717(+)
MNVVRRSALRFLYSTAGRTYYRCALNRNKAPLRYLQISRYNVSRITYAQDDDDDNTTNEDIHLDYLDEASEEGMMDENIGEELGDDDLDIDHEALLAEYPELEELVVGEDSELTPEQIAARNLNQARYWDPWYWLLTIKLRKKPNESKKRKSIKRSYKRKLNYLPSEKRFYSRNIWVHNHAQKRNKDFGISQCPFRWMKQIIPSHMSECPHHEMEKRSNHF